MVLMKKLIATLIRCYQRTLSPDHGWPRGYFPHGYCKFHPSCSEYTRLAVEKYGAIKGLVKGIYRVLRCNPCSRGGLDRP